MCSLHRPLTSVVSNRESKVDYISDRPSHTRCITGSREERHLLCAFAASRGILPGLPARADFNRFKLVQNRKNGPLLRSFRQVWGGLVLHMGAPSGGHDRVTIVKSAPGSPESVIDNRKSTIENRQSKYRSYHIEATRMVQIWPSKFTLPEACFSNNCLI